MATKSPGIYLTEHDSTQYTNPKTISGTTIAVVGFSQKGPIGVPTEITSYKNFTNTFGAPIDGFYSALAVKNILTAGGKVLFERVADSEATVSNIVVKNGIEATNGKTYLDRKSDILVGTAGYSNASLYGINVTNSSKESKDIIVRSPLAGKLSQASVLEQLNAGLAASYPTYEVIKTKNIPAGIYSFEIARNKSDGTSGVFDESDKLVAKENQGFFIETTANESLDTLVAAFQKVLKNGVNGICILTLTNSKGKPTYINPNATLNLSGTKRFSIYNGTEARPFSVSITAGSNLFTIVNAIDNVVKTYGIRATILEGDSTEGTPTKILFINKSGDYNDFEVRSAGGTASEDEELFVSNITAVTTMPVASADLKDAVYLYNGEDETTYTKGKYYQCVEGKVSTTSYSWVKEETPEDETSATEAETIPEATADLKDSLYKYTGETNDTYEQNAFYRCTESTSQTDGYVWNEVTSDLDEFTASTSIHDFYVNNSYSRNGIQAASETTNSRRQVEVAVNETTNSIVFSGPSVGAGQKIEVVAAPYGNFIFGDEGIDLGEVIGSIEGTDELTGITIDRDATRKIVFTSDNSDAPEVADSKNDKLKSLLSIEKDVDNAASVGFTKVPGNYSIDAKERDMVVISSKEKGAGTAGIYRVEFYSSTSPLTGKVKHDINIYVNGVKTETYEDVSYSYSDVENRFDTLINKTEDNGGSAYINMVIVKNDLANDEVSINDGVYTVGAAQSDDSIERTSDIEERAYTLYDYSVGNNGVPADGGDELFETAMEIDTSALADKDLFSFHVIIAPDNISETVQTAMIALCENRGDAMAIIDPPVGLDRDAVIAWHNGRGYGRGTGVDSTYAATYWPWCKVYDSTQKRYTWVMPSVVMAAKYVSVDRTAGCWFAPAGETNGVMSVVDIEQYPNVVDRDKLYVDYNRINPFMRLGDGSIICYGEKTLQRINSVLTKVHTRRMLIQIKKEAKEALRGYIFLPTTSENLQKISADMTAIFEKYKSGGGLASYTVVCDDSNNSTETLQQDIVYVDIACVPRGAIEQIEISLNLNKTDETVTVA